VIHDSCRPPGHVVGGPRPQVFVFETLFPIRRTDAMCIGGHQKLVESRISVVCLHTTWCLDQPGMWERLNVTDISTLIWRREFLELDLSISLGEAVGLAAATRSAPSCLVTWRPPQTAPEAGRVAPHIILPACVMVRATAICPDKLSMVLT
jgi:hypothetical protein